MITVSRLQLEEEEEYCRFVESCKNALYEHGLEIRDLITRHFQFEPCYLIAWDETVGGGGKEKVIVGVLPLFRAKSYIEGTRLVSLPFFPFGGVVAQRGREGEVEGLLLSEAKRLACEKGIRFLEIRSRSRMRSEHSGEFVVQSPIVDFLFHYKESIEKTFDGLDKRVRYDIRKAQKNNLRVEFGKEKIFMDDFYDVYLNTRKRRGVPAWSYELFKEALEKCDALVGVVYFNKKPIASAFFFFHKDEVEYGFGGADYHYSSLCPYYLLLWKMVELSFERGIKVLDFGGTTKEMNDGFLYAFKERWCNEKREILYYFYAQDKSMIPDLYSSFSLYRFYGKMWRMLPKSVIRRISPMILRQFK